MAFLDEADLAPKPAPAQAAAVTVIPAAPRSKLVPILLVTLNVGVLLLILVALGPKMEWPSINFGGQPADSPQPVADVGALDPAMLVTPSGRKLDTVVFGNAIFEVTRVTYYPDVRSRSVTITVPGKPPAQGVFRVGESFGGGKIRVVDIQSSGAVLEADGRQQFFGIEGAMPDQAWDRPASSSGTTMIPPTGTRLIPDLPPGQVRPAIDPRTQPAETSPATEPAPAKTPAEDDQDWSLEDLPLETYVDLERKEFEDLLIRLGEVFDRDFVLATALEADTRIPFGLEIKNLRAGNVLSAYLRKGDIILNLNEDRIIRVADLDLAARQVRKAIELRIDIQRDNEVESYIFRPGKK
ncbi:MAG: hypothetical protein KF754_07550 [Planctomycetes bacterium]|nr:hypothetical protein [Planctomycetota bacterium]